MDTYSTVLFITTIREFFKKEKNVLGSNYHITDTSSTIHYIVFYLELNDLYDNILLYVDENFSNIYFMNFYDLKKEPNYDL